MSCVHNGQSFFSYIISLHKDVPCIKTFLRKTLYAHTMHDWMTPKGNL